MKILIVKLSALGDVLSSTPFFRLLKEKYPESNVKHLVFESCSSVTKCNPWVDGQLTIEDFNLKKSVFNAVKLFKLYKEIRSNNFDCAIVLHRSWIIHLFLKCCRIKNIFGFKNKLNIFLDNSIVYRTNINRTVQEYNLFVNCGFFIRKPKKLEFYLDNSDIDFKKLTKLPVDYICCNPGGGNFFASAETRMWPLENYASFILSSTLPVVILGKGYSDELLVKKLIKLTGGRIFNLVNQTNINETALILQKSKLYVGNDSSLLYLAAAMGAKTLGLFGPTQRLAANPLGLRQSYLVGKAPCAPCYNPFDGAKGIMYKCKNNICMQNIGIQKVRQMVNGLLSERDL
jgi:heptosyltransferase II